MKYRDERERVIARCRTVSMIRKIRALAGPPEMRFVNATIGPLFNWAVAEWKQKNSIAK